MASGGGEGEVGLLVSEEVEPEAFVMRERENVAACLWVVTIYRWSGNAWIVKR